MYGREASMRLSPGISTPRSRGIVGKWKVACGRVLALPLFMPGVLANHTEDVLAFHDAARLTESLDGCSHFHGFVRVKNWVRFRGTKNRPGAQKSPARHSPVYL